jgi:succinate dehydrogenase / fumarate reductase membrane anchor subunit
MRETKLWTWHIITGIVVLVFLGLHMLIMHFGNLFHVLSPDKSAASIDWINVVSRAKMVFFMVTYIILLGAALFHGLYGLQTILFELNPRKGIKTFISTILVLLGLALFVVGTYAAIAAKNVALGA